MSTAIVDDTSLFNSSNDIIPIEIVNEPVPLRIDDTGTLRIGKTRITLDLIIEAFNQGAIPEEIVTMYSTLKLTDVYTVIGYYLRHREEIDSYLQQREKEAENFRQNNPLSVEFSEIRERLLKRQFKGAILEDARTIG